MGLILAILFFGLVVILVLVAGFLILDACGIRPLLPKGGTTRAGYNEDGRRR